MIEDRNEAETQGIDRQSISADRLIIAIGQINPAVGDLDQNSDSIFDLCCQARDADLIVFPELALVGYPPEDLILKPAFQQAAEKALTRLAKRLGEVPDVPAALVGCCMMEGEQIYNGMALLEFGKVVAVRYKYDLPSYGVFDEARVFTPGPLPEPVVWRGISLGLPICEDIWSPQVCRHLGEAGAEIFLVANGSPYEVNKEAVRQDLVQQRVAECTVPMIYVNRCGGQDELVFDGASFIVNSDGTIPVQMSHWSEGLTRTSWSRSRNGWVCAEDIRQPMQTGIVGIYHAMMVGLRDYVNRNHFPGVIIGLSGGVDSALSAAVAVDAIGPDRVQCVMMPSCYTSKDSLDDAADCARRLGVDLKTIAIGPAMDAFDTMLGPVFEGYASDITEENIQSRIRGLILMALSNKFGWMVLTTGNKSEISTGYATLYGDMCGGFNVLKDVYKSSVFELCRWRNSHKPENAKGPEKDVIPQRIITKPPSAELRPGQKDEDSLPPYKVLDAILMALVEAEEDGRALVERGFDPEVVTRVEQLLYISEYKRRQAPPGVKISKRNFGRDRRYPITHGFRSLNG